MRYLLNERYRLRGWHLLSTGLVDMAVRKAQFFQSEEYRLLLKCDGAHQIEKESLSETQRNFLDLLEKGGIIRKAAFGRFLKPEQEYFLYPCQYREDVHWSITGACNLKCRHCFMSAPHAKHGVPTHEQIIAIADQLAECGVLSAGLTGGEPLIREDFLEIVDALKQRDIGVSIIYTNGWLVDEKLLDELEKRGVRCPFQLSYDGIGMHDFLRGIPGAEERTIRALKLLQERKIPVSVSMCLHRKNGHTLRESVKLMASLGVRSMKLGSMLELGEWASPEMQELQLTPAEAQNIFLEYIPQYFEDNAPLSIMLGGAFMYTPGEDRWGIYHEQPCSTEDEGKVPSCGVLSTNFYIGADGMVTPCMSMGDCSDVSRFPNLFKTPLKDILRDSEYTRLSEATVKDVRDRNEKCRDCEFIDRCAGGCRAAALIAGEDYYGIDPELCEFFKNGWDRQIHEVTQPAFEAYLKRCPPGPRQETEAIGTEICP